jgi:hypothetical protein
MISLKTFAAWINRKCSAIRREVVRQLDATKAIPYCYIYSLSGPFVPPVNFKARAYPGLIAWHVVAGPATPKVVSYWQDEPRYQYCHTRFESALNLTGADGCGGGVGDLHGKEPTWLPSTLKEVFVAITSAFGTAIMIWSTFVPIGETLLTTPKAEVSFALPNVDITEGETARVAVTARNATEFVSVHLIASAHLTGNGSPQPVLLDPAFYQNVEPNASEALTAIIKAPLLSRQISLHPVPADYKLLISAAVRTWRLQQPKPAQGGELPVRVWPRSFGWTPSLRRIIEKNSTLYNATGRLCSGALFPAGLKGTITILVPETVDLDINVLSPFRRLQRQPDPSVPANGMKTILVDFSSPPLEKNHEYPFQVIITPKSGQAPQGGWDMISMQVNFGELTGG